jgi:putative DNA primase/helicase
MEMLKRIGLEPTLVVKTGGGLHVYWLFNIPHVIKNQSDREEMMKLSKGFQSVFRKRFEAHGWQLDRTADLARILRLPGTLNHKNDPTLVEIMKHDDAKRYTVEEIKKFMKRTENATLMNNDKKNDVELSASRS